MEPSSAPGWYPDPTRRYEFRYHNGQRWTADVSVHGQRFVENDTAAVSAPGQPLAPAQHASHPYATQQPYQSGPPPYQPQFQQLLYPGSASPGPGRGFAITAFVLGLGAVLTAWLPFVFALAALAALAALTFGIISLARRSPGKPFAVWGVVLATLALPLCAVGWHLSVEVIDEFTDPGPYAVEITSCEYTNLQGVARGTIRNLDEIYRDYTITVEFTIDGFRSQRSTTIRRVAGGSTDTFVVAINTITTSTSFPDIECRVSSVGKPFP